MSSLLDNPRVNSQRELYYLRLLLTKVRGPKNYTDIMTVNQVVHSTFRGACYALGLLDDDNEFIDAIKEASLWASGNYLHKFFTSMLLSYSLSQPHVVWEQTKHLICEDLLNFNHADPQSTDVQISNDCKEATGLYQIEQNDYPSMPIPDEDNIIDMSCLLILQEINYNREKEMEAYEKMQRLLIEEQKAVFDEIMNAISSKNGGYFFVHGFGGTGKIFIRAKALNDISSGEDILLHRMDMNPSESKLPFNMIRRQFPIIISFAMTINKSQGQSMSHVGLYLPSPVFSHGQLYVALSRVRSFKGLKIIILNGLGKSSSTTTNVVYREVFQNLDFK